jgi:hypothetical protein
LRNRINAQCVLPTQTPEAKERTSQQYETVTPPTRAGDILA